MFSRKALILVLLAATLAFSGCKSAQQKAAEHFAAAQELIKKGDETRAIIEFRNVFQLDPKNRDAHMAFAQLLEKRGSLPAAYGQYQQVTEWYPKDLEAIKAAARAAAKIGNWVEAGRQVKAGLALSPDDRDLLVVKAATDYAAAVKGQDDKAQADAAATAKDLLANHSDSLLLRRVVIDHLMRTQQFDAAEQQIDTGITLLPKEKSLYVLKVSVLSARKDDAGIEAELKKMIDIFPEDPAMGATLVRWYVTHNQLDAAEAYLRKAAEGDSLQPKLDLVGFLTRYRGTDAALSELDKVIAAAPAETAPASGDQQPTTTVRTFRALRASILFDKGERQKGIDQMKAVVDSAPESDETRRIKVTLARMQAQTGDMVSARALVEEVLKQDKGQLEAIKLKAGWLVQGDNPDDAITLLRDALDAHPNDVQIMTLMAEAYQRTGNHQLMGDMLSQAVQASNRAPQESIRYANFLVQDKKYLPAESVLVGALQLDPGNVGILTPLGQLYVLMKDWPRATQVADRLDQIGTPEAKQVSEGLRPAILAGQQKVDEAVSYLQGIAAQGGGKAAAADIAILRTLLAAGEAAKAQATAQAMLAKAPDDPQTRFIVATVQAATGDPADAEATYRDLVKQDPTRLRVWLALIGQLNGTGQGKAARAALDEAQKALPDAADLQMIRAGFMENDGDVDGAIKIYDALYQKNTGNLILANNLASLLASYHGNDPKSLDQAYNIARRLQGTTVPAFEDTYGWISFLRGDVQGARSYLEAAAKAMPKEPLAQYHLAEVYRALNRPEDAKAQYAKVVALVRPDDKRAFVEASRAMMKTTPKPDTPQGG